MPMYNLTEYSDDYSDTSGSLWQFKRDEQNMNNGVPSDVNTKNSTSFKYKSSLVKDSVADGNNRVFKDVKKAVPLKYLSNFWRSLEMPLINSKIHLELSWTKDCVMSCVAGAAEFKITNTTLYVPIVTLLIKDNVKLVKLSEDGFSRSAYWNEYQAKIETRTLDDNSLTRFPLDPAFQGVRRLLVLAFNNTTDNDNNPINDTVFKSNHRKYFLPKVNITNCNALIDERNFYDLPIDYLIKQYDGIRKISAGQGDDYTTGCLLDYQYFKDYYNLIAVDIIKQKELDADSRAIQRIAFYGILKTNSQVCTIKRNKRKCYNSLKEQ